MWHEFILLLDYIQKAFVLILGVLKLIFHLLEFILNLN